MEFRRVLFRSHDRRRRRGRTSEHRADGDPGRDACGYPPAFVRLVALAADHRAIPSNADESFFANSDRTAAPDGHGALFTHHDAAAARAIAVPVVHVHVAVDVHIRVAVDVHVPIDVLVDVAVVVVAPVGAGVAVGGARLPNRTARAAAVGGEIKGCQDHQDARGECPDPERWPPPKRAASLSVYFEHDQLLSSHLAFFGATRPVVLAAPASAAATLGSTTVAWRMILIRR